MLSDGYRVAMDNYLNASDEKKPEILARIINLATTDEETRELLTILRSFEEERFPTRSIPS